MILDLDPDQLHNLGIGFGQSGSTAILKFGDVTARVLVEDGKLKFHPDRSSAHKAILSLLTATPV
jgi:hypothetical protein